MKVNREELLNALKFAKLGTPTRGETLEQSNAFVFVGGNLITFDDEIMTRSPSPFEEDVEVAVLADEFLKLVEKFPDEELDITIKGEEIHLKGNKKDAGVTCFNEILLPYDAVPKPGKMTELHQDTPKMLQQAARTCGNDVTQELTTVVHVSPDMIEACDNWRMFRVNIPTGFNEEGLLPASSIMKLNGLNLSAVSIVDGWAHFKTNENKVISIRCSKEKYHEGMDQLLNIGDAEQVNLPPNLSDVINRTIVMMNVEDDPKIKVHLKEGQLVLESRKESGWYKERKGIKYSGKDIVFEVNPKFLMEILQRTRKVFISQKKRMKIVDDNIIFVVAMYQE